MRATRQSNHNTRGAIVIVTAIIVTIVLLLIAGIVIFSGYHAVDKSQLQNVANLGALGALEEFTESSGTFDVKAQSALIKARKVAEGGALKAEGDSLDSISLGGSADRASSLTLGSWYSAAPDNLDETNDPCHGNYPCFAEEPNPAANILKINAARLKLCNTSDENPILKPLSGAGIQKCATATASLANRCIVFLVDTSLSTFQDTHFSRIFTDSCATPGSGCPASCSTAERYYNCAEKRIEWPRVNPAPFNPETNRTYSSLPVFQEKALQGVDCGDKTTIPSLFTYRDQAVLWCAMAPQRPASGGSGDSRVHYQSDYHSAAYRYWNGSEWVEEAVRYDAYKGGDYFAPQPFGNIFLGINVALRTLAQQKTGGDKALLLGFNRNISARIPETGFASNLDDLIRVSNLNNRGTYDASGGAVDPRGEKSVLNYGLLPLYGGGPQSGDNLSHMQDTNIPLALDVAVDLMKRECAPNSKKEILLFSDGMTSCARAYTGSGDSKFKASMLGQPIPTLSSIDYTCGKNVNTRPDSASNNYSHYLNAQKQLKGRAAGDQDSILFALQEAGITLNTFIVGNSVLPSEHNRIRWEPAKDPVFLTQTDAAELGLGKSFRGENESGHYYNFFPANIYYPGMWDRLKNNPLPANMPPLPDDSTCPISDPGFCACYNLPRPGFFCGLPNKLFGEMALDTGGIHCPLRPLCSGAVSFDGSTADEVILSRPPCPGDCGNNLCYEQDGSLSRYARDWQGAYHNADSTNCGAPFFGNVQTCAIINESKSQQAARCARDIVGGNPFILVEDKIYGDAP